MPRLLFFIATFFLLGWAPASWSQATSSPPTGFSAIVPSPTAVIVYVSNVGDDSATGEITDPLLTIAAAERRGVAGRSLCILLHAGEVFRESLHNWIWPGNGPADQSIIGSYGSGPRPVLLCGTGNGLYIGGGGGAPASMQWLAIVGLDLYASVRDPVSADYVAGSPGGSGVQLLLPSSNITIEDCRIRDFANGISIIGDDGPISHVTIRRSIVLDSWNGAGHAQGLYIAKVDQLLIEENVIDHCGWSADPAGVPTIFNHAIYLTDVTHLTERANVISNASSFGTKSGSEIPYGCGPSLIEANLFAGDGNNLTFGTGTGGPASLYQQSGAHIRGNVFHGTGRTLGGTLQSYGIAAVSCDGLWVDSNLFLANQGGVSMLVGLESSNVGYRDVQIAHNVAYAWTDTSIQVPAIAATAVSQWANHPQAGLTGTPRTPDTYAQALGLVNEAAWLVSLRNRPSGQWSAAYSALSAVTWLRAGYGLPATIASPDFNADGVVNVLDQATLARLYGQKVTPWTAGDMNGDGRVDIFDLCLWAARYNAAWPPPPTAGGP